MLKLKNWERSSTSLIVGALLLLFVSSSPKEEVEVAHLIDSMVIFLHQEIELSLLVQRRSNDLSIKRFARKVIRKNRSDIKLLTSWREAYFSREKTLWEDHQFKSDNLMDLKDRQFNNFYIDKMNTQLDQVLFLMKRKVRNKKYDFLRAYLLKNEKVVKERKKALQKMNDRTLN